LQDTIFSWINLFSFLDCWQATLKMARLQNLQDNTISNQAVPTNERKAGAISIHFSILQEWTAKKLYGNRFRKGAAKKGEEIHVESWLDLCFEL
jgi:hypothetical protein